MEWFIGSIEDGPEWGVCERCEETVAGERAYVPACDNITTGFASTKGCSRQSGYEGLRPRPSRCCAIHASLLGNTCASAKVATHNGWTAGTASAKGCSQQSGYEGQRPRPPRCCAIHASLLGNTYASVQKWASRIDGRPDPLAPRAAPDSLA